MEVGARIDVVRDARRDDRKDVRGPLAANVEPSEQPVSSAEDDGGMTARCASTQARSSSRTGRVCCWRRARRWSALSPASVEVRSTANSRPMIRRPSSAIWSPERAASTRRLRPCAQQPGRLPPARSMKVVMLVPSHCTVRARFSPRRRRTLCALPRDHVEDLAARMPHRGHLGAAARAGPLLRRHGVEHLDTLDVRRERN